MARTVANLDVTSDTFQNWVNKTNELLYSLTTEIITGNSSISNTGTTLEPRKAQLIGRFGANTLVATDELRGGNVGDSGYALLTITSNTLFGGNSSVNASFVNAQSNVYVNNAVLQVNSQTITITGNTSIKGNTSVTAITVTGNATVSNTIITGTDLFVTAVNTSVNSRSIFTGNTYIKANSTVTNITVQGNGTTANTILAGNLTQITSNLDITGTLHTIAGNVNFDSAVLFVDATNNRVGINNNAPDAVFVVTGTANVSGATRLSNTLNVVGAVTLSNTLGVTNTATLANTLIVTGAVTFSNTLGLTGAATLANTVSVTGATTLANTLGLTGAATFANTLGLTGAATLANTILVVGNTSLSNSITVTGNTILANSLAVTGNSTLANTLVVTGNTILANSLAVTGNVIFSNTLNVNGLLTAAANLNVTGTTNVSSNLNVGTFGTTNGVNVVNTTIIVGNTTSNALISGNLVSVSNTANLTSTTLTIGATTVNASQVNSALRTSGLFGVTNGSTINATFMVIGNTTSNAIVSGNLISISNTANLTSTTLTIGTTTVNSSLVNAAAINVVNQTNTGTLYVSTTANIAGLLNAAAGLVVTGTANIIGGGGATVLARFATGAFPASGVNIIPNATAGTLNPLVAQGDILLNFSSGGTGSGNLVIAPWSGNTGGIKINGLINDIALVGNSFTFTTGNSNFDSGTLFVDALNNRIGINNTAPGVALRVTGDADISSTANIQSNANVGGTLGVASLLTASALNVTNQTNTATLYVTTSANVGTVFTVNATITNSAANVQLTTNATAGFVGIGRTPTSTTKLFVNSQFATDSGTFGIQNRYIVANTSITAPRGYYGIFNQAENVSLNSDGATTYASDMTSFQTYAYNGPGDAAIDQMYGALMDVRNYANGTLGNTVTLGVGTRSAYYSFGSGVTTTAYGVRAVVAAGNNAITGNIGNAYGVLSDITSNTSMTIGTGYLFVGQFNGATTTNKFGVFITGESNNYFSSNVSIAGGLLVSTNSSFDSGTLFVDAVNNRVGINNTAPGVALRVTGDVDISSTANIQGNANVGGTLGVVGALTLSNNITVAGNAVFSNAISVANASTFANTVSITGAATLANTVSVTGATTLANTSSHTGAATFSNTVAITGTTTINTDYVIQVTANSNLGATVGSPLLVYSFPKATYSSAKLTSQVKTLTGNTQISEIVLAHDTTTPYITVYATVASPFGANNGIYSVAINNANVELSFTQTSSSSAAKIVAHLIK